MASESVLRQADNISRASYVKGLGTERKGAIRTKTNALGDVKNTLHSRSVSFLNQNTNSAKSIQRKNSVSVDDGDKNTFAATGSKSEAKNHSFLTPPDYEFHDHSLCEREYENYLNNLYSEYKLTEKQIDDFVKSTKRFTLEKPSVDLYCDPLEDIEIPDEIIDDSSNNNIFENFILPEVPAPPKLLEVFVTVKSVKQTLN